MAQMVGLCLSQSFSLRLCDELLVGLWPARSRTAETSETVMLWDPHVQLARPFVAPQPGAPISTRTLLGAPAGIVTLLHGHPYVTCNRKSVLPTCSC